MKTIYIIRHGATTLNQDGRARGWSDTPLSNKGKEEVKQTADKLADSGIDCIYSSDLKRAIQTAQAIKETTGAKVIPLYDLRTWNIGSYQGESSKKVNPELMRYASEYPNRTVPGGESFNSFKRRVFNGLREAVSDKRDTVAIVTHRRVERLLRGWIENGQPADKSIDFKHFFSEVDPPGHAETVSINPNKLKATAKAKAISKFK